MYLLLTLVASWTEHIGQDWDPWMHESWNEWPHANTMTSTLPLAVVLLLGSLALAPHTRQESAPQTIGPPLPL